jgi:hypothetical protein
VQPAGNHQVKNQPKIILDANCNALAQAPQFADNVTFHDRKRRSRGSQEKGACQPYPLEWLTDNAWLECVDIGGNIG